MIQLPDAKTRPCPLCGGPTTVFVADLDATTHPDDTTGNSITAHLVIDCHHCGETTETTGKLDVDWTSKEDD